MPPRRQTTLKSIGKQLDIVIENQDTILHNLQILRKQGRQNRMANEKIAQALAQLNEATNDVAGQLDSLKQQIQGGISSEEADTIVSQLDAASQKLRALAADPDNPVPA